MPASSTRGLAVVTTGSKKTRALFSCIHHGVDTHNWRELEKHVEKDAEDEILTRRKKEETSTNEGGTTLTLPLRTLER